MSHQKELTQYHVYASRAGISYAEAETLRRTAMTMHRRAEHECNGVLIQAEAGMIDHNGRALTEGKCYSVWGQNINGPLRYTRTADRETPARERAEAIAKKYGATLEFQGDPRGCPLSFALNGITLYPPTR